MTDLAVSPQAAAATRSPCRTAGSRSGTRRPRRRRGQGPLLLRHATWSPGATRPARPTCMDAFCPHLGAHLGHGGDVEGCELVCPFHGWKFDAEGANTDIPYSDRTNRKARIRTYPGVERNDFVMVWYHPDGGAADVGDRRGHRASTDAEFSGPTRTDHIVQAAHPGAGREPVDSAHFRYVHNTETVPEIEKYETDGHVRRHAVGAEVPDAARRRRRAHRHRQRRPGPRHRALQRHRRHAARHRLDTRSTPSTTAGALQLLRPQPRRRGDELQRRRGLRRTRSASSSRRTRRSGSTRPTSSARRSPTTTARS